MNLGHHIWLNKVYAKLKETICSANLPEKVCCPFCDGEGEVMLLRNIRIKDGKEEHLKIPENGIDVDFLRDWNDGKLEGK